MNSTMSDRSKDLNILPSGGEEESLVSTQTKNSLIISDFGLIPGFLFQNNQHDWTVKINLNEKLSFTQLMSDICGV